MLEWVLFNVTLPLLPVPLVWLIAWLTNKRRGLIAVLRDGQLCFYSTTLTAATIYDIAKVDRDPSSLPRSALAMMRFGQRSDSTNSARLGFQ